MFQTQAICIRLTYTHCRLCGDLPKPPIFTPEVAGLEVDSP